MALLWFTLLTTQRICETMKYSHIQMSVLTEYLPECISVTLKMEAACSTEILEYTYDDTAQHNNPGNHHLSIISCERLKI